MADVTQKHLWWQTGVVYQVYPRSFKDTNGDGVGDLAGVIDKLDYLRDDLGIDVIWLSPFYPSPMADFGYDVADYTGVDPLFGDLATYDRLLEEAHQRDLKVIIDLVPNHSSDQHPWFVESRSSRVNPKRDWYVWADAKTGGAPPNNWLSIFGGCAWEWDVSRGQYYLHSFLKEQPDLNWRNPELKAAMFDVVRFWLERGTDGFRIDVAHFIMKDPDLRDNPPNTTGSLSIHRPLGEYDSIIHVHDQAHPDVHQVYREFRRVLDDYSRERPRMSVGEIYMFDWARWASFYGEHLDELHMPFNFSLLNVPWRASAVRDVVGQLEGVLPEGAWPNYVVGNHDESRPASRFGPAQARVAAMLLLTLRGTPTLYYGDEIGMTDVDVPDDMCVDPWGFRVAGQGRDKCRTPMQWNPGRNAGFSNPATAALWLPLAPDYKTVNVAVEMADERSILTLYRRLLASRRRSPALRWGDYTPVDGGPEDCFCYTRRADGQEILVALNFSMDDQYLSRMPARRGNVLVSTWLDREGPMLTKNCRLRPHEGLVILLG